MVKMRKRFFRSTVHCQYVICPTVEKPPVFLVYREANQLCGKSIEA